MDNRLHQTRPFLVTFPSIDFFFVKRPKFLTSVEEIQKKNMSNTSNEYHQPTTA